MNLKYLSDEKLLADTKTHAKQEKESGIAVLHHICEVDARRLFAKNHGRLYGYCREELEMSEGTAGRRIQAMKLIRDLPEYESKLNSATNLRISSTSRSLKNSRILRLESSSPNRQRRQFRNRKQGTFHRI